MRELAFTDFEAYVAAIGDADLQMMLPRMQKPRWDISAIPVGGIHIQHGREGSGNLVEGAGREGATVVFLPTVGFHRANGAPLDKRSLLVIEPKSEFSIAVQDAHLWYSIAIPQQAINQEQSDRVRGRSHVLVPGVESVNRIQKIVSDVFEAARLEPNVLTTAATVKRMESRLLTACNPIFGVAAERVDTVGRPIIFREHIIRSAMTVFEQYPDFTLSVDDLANAADVSVRTLRTAFLEFFGVPPRRYLLTKRLHQARKALIQTTPEVSTVTEIATRFGFWQFGRFAGEYVRLFGERPSETLRRRSDASILVRK